MKLKSMFVAVALLTFFVPTVCRAQFNDVRKLIVRPKVAVLNNPSVQHPMAKTPNLHAFTSDSSMVQAPTAADSLQAMPLFSHPLEGKTLRVTSHFGFRTDPFNGKHKFHQGTDFRTATENVYAMMPGRIRKIGYDKRLGNYIRIDHGDWEVTYGHLYTVRGRKGDYVDAGHSVGISGSTGRSTGEHLHVSVKYKGDYIDPYPFIRYIVDQTQKQNNGREENVMTEPNVSL